MKYAKQNTPNTEETPCIKDPGCMGLRRAARFGLEFGNYFALGLCCLVFAPIGLLRAQSYSIDWFTIAGGGGTSTGAVYSVSGSVGQPDAGGPLTGGNFSLNAGFWSFLSALQTPGSPALTITLTSTNTAIVSWAYPAAGFNLQQNADLNSTNWVSPPQIVSNNGSINFIIVNPPTGTHFYRLLKP